MIESFLFPAAAVFSGLLAGSLLLEGLVLVPFWKNLKFKEFFAFHHLFGQALFRYFAPLTTAGVAAPILAALWAGGQSIWLNVSAVGSLAVLLFFPFYFKRANEAFTNKQVAEADLPGRLAQWARVHTLRTVISLVAFGAAVIGTRIVG
jgi:hypothetical protein